MLFWKMVTTGTETRSRWPFMVRLEFWYLQKRKRLVDSHAIASPVPDKTQSANAARVIWASRSVAVVQSVLLIP